MDPDRFDALARFLSHTGSRRRAAAALGGVFGGVFSMSSLEEAAAKKKCPRCKKRKNGKCKKNKPDGTACAGGTCQGGRCQSAGNPPADPCPGQKPCKGGCIATGQCCISADCPSGYQCCSDACSDTKKPADAFCFTHAECCSDFCRSSRLGVSACAATCRGQQCTLAEGCCRGFTCLNVDSTTGFGTCGGCRHGGSPCESDADCCFSACTASPNNPQKGCVSYAGGPCERSIDCKSCAVYGECTVTIDGTTRDICHNGVCRCPDNDECCPNKPCPGPADTCQVDQYGLNGVCKSPDIGG